MRTYSRKKIDYQVIEGVKDLCRLCLEKCEEVVPIFTDNSGVCAALPMRIMICVGLEMVREECLPNIICQNCHKELERYYSFRKKCEVTYQKLKAHMLAMREQEAVKPKVDNKQDVKMNVNQNIEIHLQNGDENGQLVLALNENEQLQLVSVVGLNGVVQVCEKQYDQAGSQLLQQCIEKNEIQQQVNVPSNQMLQQCVGNGIQMQDISTTSQSTSISEEVDLSIVLPSVLLRLGVLSEDGGMLRVNLRRVELQAAGGECCVLELVEEDEDVQSTELPPTYQEVQIQVTETTNVPVKKEVEVPIVEKPKVVEEPKVKETKQKKRSTQKRAVIHSDNPPSKPGAWCETCGKIFSSRSVLARHRRTHSAERPYECKTCGRMFSQRAVLTRHELVHLVNRPFKCPECPKSFTQRSALTAHSRSHAAPLARPLSLHLCSICPKVFLYPSGLSRHMPVHEGRVFTCDDCDRQFRDKSALMRHVNKAGHRRM